MKKLLLLLLCVPLIGLGQDTKEFTKNLDHFKNLVDDINTYFIDSTLANLEISNYYTEDFVFYSYPAGKKKKHPTFLSV